MTIFIVVSVYDLDQILLRCIFSILFFCITIITKNDSPIYFGYSKKLFLKLLPLNSIISVFILCF